MTSPIKGAVTLDFRSTMWGAIAHPEFDESAKDRSGGTPGGMPCSAVKTRAGHDSAVLDAESWLYF